MDVTGVSVTGVDGKPVNFVQVPMLPWTLHGPLVGHVQLQAAPADVGQPFEISCVLADQGHTLAIAPLYSGQSTVQETSTAAADITFTMNGITVSTPGSYVLDAYVN